MKEDYLKIYFFVHMNININMTLCFCVMPNKLSARTRGVAACFLLLFFFFSCAIFNLIPALRVISHAQCRFMSCFSFSNPACALTGRK